MTRAEIEAVVWVKCLSVTKITVERLQKFWAWRRDPENRRAYDEASRQLDAAREAGDVWSPTIPRSTRSVSVAVPAPIPLARWAALAR